MAREKLPSLPRNNLGDPLPSVRSNGNPIYHPLFLEAAKAELRQSPTDSVDDALEQISKLADTYSQPPLPKGLVADLWALQKGYLRPALRDVTPPLVLVDVTEKGRLARLKMEWIEGDGCSGIPYPHPDMAGSMDDEGKYGGIFTDAAWDCEINAARGHAKANGFVIPMDADVRWRVELVSEADARARGSICKANMEPWKPGALLRGRSAGAAFLIGLVYLVQRAREGTPIASEMRAIVNTLLPLLVLPALPERGPLRELGAPERAKLDAIRHHLGNLTLIFPENHGDDVTPDALCVPDVAALVHHVIEQIKSESVPNTIPPALHAANYVGGGRVDALVTSLRRPGVVVVYGPAGIGKTAFAIEAIKRLVDEGEFPDGRLYFSFYTTAMDDASQRRSMLESIVTGLDETAAENIPELKAQVRDLLAVRRVLILLEGAENVPAAAISDILEPLGSNTHIVWLTRRADDAREPGLDGCPAHEVLPLSPDESRNLLCYHYCGRDPSALDAATCEALDSIALDAGHTPQLLVWAGRALGHDPLATPAQFAAEIHEDPLTRLPNRDMNRRREETARCFLERSLARIRPKAEFQTLDATARRLFAALAAFHLAYGAPPKLWAIAAGLDTTQRMQRREFGEASRELLSLRLARSDDEERTHPVHALAAALAAALWHEQPVETRTTVLNSLARAAVQHLVELRPLDWQANAQWIATTTAFARNSEHWITSAGFDVSSDIAGQLAAAWVHLGNNFCAGIRELQQHPLGLLESVGSAVCAHIDALARVHPKNLEYQPQLAQAWGMVGGFRNSWQDFTGAEQAYAKAVTIAEALAREYPEEPDYEYSASASWVGIGDMRTQLDNRPGAEQAYAKAEALAAALVKKYPNNREYSLFLSRSLDRLAVSRSRRQDWTGNKQARDEAFTIAEALARVNPKEAEYQIRLIASWNARGNVCHAAQDWPGAEQAYAKAEALAAALVKEYPEVHQYKSILGVAQAQMAEIAEHPEDWQEAVARWQDSGCALPVPSPIAEDWQEAVARWQRACKTVEHLVAASSGETAHVGVLISCHLGLARVAALAGKLELAHTAAESGIAHGIALSAAREAEGLEQSKRQQQLLIELQCMLRAIEEALSSDAEGVSEDAEGDSGNPC